MCMTVFLLHKIKQNFNKINKIKNTCYLFLKFIYLLTMKVLYN